MNVEANPLNYNLRVEDGMWKLSFGQGHQLSDRTEITAGSPQDARLMWIGTASGPKALTKEEAMEIVRSIFLMESGSKKAMTVAEFVESRFVPVYLARRSPSTRINYRSILKLIIDPDRVDRAFGSDAPKEGKRMRFSAEWPYLGDVLLEEVGPEFVQNLINTAIRSGYSMHTVSQIRNAVCMIFAFAALEQDYSGKNPARCLEWPSLRRRSVANRTLRSGIPVPRTAMH